MSGHQTASSIWPTPARSMQATVYQQSQPLRLPNSNVTIGCKLPQHLPFARRPHNAGLVYAVARAEAEVEARIVMGQIASAVSHGIELPMTASFDSDLRAETVAIAGAAFERETDPAPVARG